MIIQTVFFGTSTYGYVRPQSGDEVAEENTTIVLAARDLRERQGPYKAAQWGIPERFRLPVSAYLARTNAYLGGPRLGPRRGREIRIS